MFSPCFGEDPEWYTQRVPWPPMVTRDPSTVFNLHLGVVDSGPWGVSPCLSCSQTLKSMKLGHPSHFMSEALGRLKERLFVEALEVTSAPRFPLL